MHIVGKAESLLSAIHRAMSLTVTDPAGQYMMKVVLRGRTREYLASSPIAESDAKYEGVFLAMHSYKDNRSDALKMFRQALSEYDYDKQVKVTVEYRDVNQYAMLDPLVTSIKVIQ